MDGQYAGFADPHRIERVSQPRENRVVGLDPRSMQRLAVSKLPLRFILVDAEFCAQPIDDAACLHASVALDMSAVSDHRQPGFIRNGRIIRRRSVERIPKFFQPFAGQSRFLRERQHFKFCFVHAGPVKLPLLG